MPSVYDEPFAVRLPENPYAAALGAASPLWSLYAGAVTAGLSLWGVARAASFGLTAEQAVAAPQTADAAEPDVAPAGEYWAVNPVEQGPGDPFAFDQSPETADVASSVAGVEAGDEAPAYRPRRKRRKAAAEG